MEQEDTLLKGSITHAKHDDVSDDEFISTPWDGNASDDMCNAPTGPVTHRRSKGQNVVAKGFVIMLQGVSWLTNGWRIFQLVGEMLNQ